MKKQTKPQREHVSVKEAAQLLQVDGRTVINMLHRGELQGYKRTLGLTSPFRVYLDSINRVLEQREFSKRKQ
jgi:excisionase family DNA binding protein